jgi:hypothetical protein
MRERSVPLTDACGGIVVGIQTSADDVYHLIRLAPGRYWSWALNKEVELEDEIMKHLVSGEDAIPFGAPSTDKYLLFPYLVTPEEKRLLNRHELAKSYKRALAYLKLNESRLRSREDGKMDHPGWYGYVYPKNLDKQTLPKIGVPQTVNRLQAFIDAQGALYFNNVRVNGILERADKKYTLWYLLALMNSTALDYFFKKTAKPKDRDYFEANKQFIAPLPIPKAKDQKLLADLARRLSDLHGQRLAAMKGVQRRLAVDLAPAELVATSPLPPKLPGKLQAFDELTLGQLMDEMERFAKRKFKPADRARWDEYLTAQINAVAGVNRQIGDLTAELNDRANALYGLSPEDVKIIADSLA